MMMMSTANGLIYSVTLVLSYLFMCIIIEWNPQLMLFALFSSI